MYVIINISGKQFRAEKGSMLKVPKQDIEAGKKTVYDDVIMFNDGNFSIFEKSQLKETTVSATILDHGRDKKILVYKKKRRKSYQRKNGHRQWYTNIEVNDIKVAAKAPSAKAPSAKAPSAKAPAAKTKKTTKIDNKEK